MALIEMSASSFKKGDMCPRALVFAKVDKLPDPAGPAAELGSLVHGQEENWVRDGVLPTHPLAIELMKYAPAPKTAWVEHEFHFEAPGDVSVKWRGYIDFLAGYNPETLRTHLVDSDIVLVGDYKTSSDIGKYALRPDHRGLLIDSDGKTDPQSTLYAYYAFSVMGAKRVFLRWAYVQTKGAQSSRRVEVEVDRASCYQAYAHMHLRAIQYVELLTIRPKANTVPYRSSGCFAFRKPCPFTEHCVRPQGMFISAPLDLDRNERTTMTDFLAAMKNSFPVTSASTSITNGHDSEPPPPPPEDDEDVPPPPPEDEEHEAIRLVQEIYAAQGKPIPRNLAKPEVGFINAPEAAELESAPVDPAHAVEIFGAEPVVEKVKKDRGRPRKARATGDVAEVPADQKVGADINKLVEILTPSEPGIVVGYDFTKPAAEEDARVVTAYRDGKVVDPIPAIRVEQLRQKHTAAEAAQQFDADERLRRIIHEELRAYFSR